jgi:histone H2A
MSLIPVDGFLFLAEVLELSGNAAHDYRKRRIIPRHILLAIGNDEELNKVFE